MHVAQCKSIICHLVCSSGWSLDREEGEAPIFYIINFVTEFCLTKDLHSCELALSLSLNGLMQIINSSGFSLKLFCVLRCTIVCCWCSGGVKLQLCHSTVQILMRVLAAVLSDMSYSSSGSLVH